MAKKRAPQRHAIMTLLCIILILSSAMYSSSSSSSSSYSSPSSPSSSFTTVQEPMSSAGTDVLRGFLTLLAVACGWIFVSYFFKLSTYIHQRVATKSPDVSDVEESHVPTEETKETVTI